MEELNKLTTKGKPRYKELKYRGKVITEPFKIDKILIDNEFNWLLDAEIQNARIEIYKNTLTWSNGVWYYGVWRDGFWLYGTLKNGVWYNGHWEDGKFLTGLIFNGRFVRGEILGGEIKNGEFLKCTIGKKVKRNTMEEQEQPEEKFEAQPQKLEKLNYIDNWNEFNESVSKKLSPQRTKPKNYMVVFLKNKLETTVRVDDAKNEEDAKKKALETVYYTTGIKHTEKDIKEIRNL